LSDEEVEELRERRKEEREEMTSWKFF